MVKNLYFVLYVVWIVSTYLKHLLYMYKHYRKLKEQINIFSTEADTIIFITVNCCLIQIQLSYEFWSITIRPYGSEM